MSADEKVDATTVSQDFDAITVYVVRDNGTRFGMIIDRNITMRDFTRAIQHRSTFAIPKKNMRLSVLEDDGETWTRFYCRRSMADHDISIYDHPLSSMAIADQTFFKVEWVLSRYDIASLTVMGVLAVPAAATASLSIYGLVSGGFVTGYLAGFLLKKAVIQHAFNKAKAMILPPDMPGGVLELRKF